MANKKIILETDWFLVESEELYSKALQGKPFYRFVIPDSVMILALTEDQKILLIKQYRHSVESFTLELPSGMIDNGETPQKAAERELYEETGYICKNLYLLGEGTPWIDRAKSRAFLFYGQGAVKDGGFKSEENIKVIPVSVEKLKELSVSGRFKQMQSFALFLLAKWKFGLEIC